ncbi:AraC family transcriptional regulator [Catenovulum agarivorans DS-2]|uniref:AraC family transcriptional regulator n=1 Tax=Catenovulum agarivorans DS-2 TaxID=1328313 RepID=W7Q623_9ALTE|nr:helix-turn-helix transcriptional regulator [Catenovulum agarivorans]EWH08224.1 AraC family transcriptional regulator [Catenovulum agarivorans DS-2]
MTPTITIQSLLLFLAAGQGVVFAVLLYFRGRKSRAINIHLSILLFAFSFEVLQKFLLDTGYIYTVPFLVGASLPVDASVGIALYWYVRQATCPEKDNRTGQVFKHYSFFIACIVLSIPYWLLPFEQKLYLMQTGVISNEWPALTYYGVGIQTIGKIISFFVYLFLCLKMLLEHKNRINNIFSYREHITLRWLTNLLWLFLFGGIQGIAILLFFQDSEEVTAIMGFLELFSVAVIFYIGVMGLLQPRIYRGKERSYVRAVQAVDEQAVEQKAKYHNSALSEADMLRISNKLDKLMSEDCVYLQADLSMPQLADMLSVSANYLSQTLNSVYQMSFFDYVNQQRIAYAKQQLSNPKLKDKSVVDVAVDSGFNSRSAFYTAFNKNVGMTPAQYRRSIQQGQ